MFKDSPFRLAVGSFREQYENKVTVISLNEVTGKLEESVELEHSYPATKVGFVPDLKCVRRDLVATAGEFLCIYELEGGNFKSVRKLRKVSVWLEGYFVEAEGRKSGKLTVSWVRPRVGRGGEWLVLPMSLFLHLSWGAEPSG